MTTPAPHRRRVRSTPLGVPVEQQRLRLKRPETGEDWQRYAGAAAKRFLSIWSWDGWSKLTSIATAVAAIAALWFSGRSLQATQHQQSLSEQTAVTDRFTRAIASLGSDNLDERLGGIYSLERLSRDSVADRPAIMDILGAYVRGRAPVPLPNKVDEQRLSTLDEPAAHCPFDPAVTTVPIDLQAAITVINRRDPAIPDLRRIDLSHSCLNRMNLGVHLHGLNLSDSDLSGSEFEDPVTAERPGGDSESYWRVNVDLSDTNLIRANLSNLRVYVRSINLSGAHLVWADLSDAYIPDADLSRAYMSSAKLTNATLSNAKLQNADLSEADLSKADLAFADLRSANLLGANLEGATLSGADLTDATIDSYSLKNIFYNSETKWPKGFKPPPSS